MAILTQESHALDEEESLRRKLRLAKLSYDSCMESPPRRAKLNSKIITLRQSPYIREKVPKEQVEVHARIGVWEFFHKIIYRGFSMLNRPKLCERHVDAKKHIYERVSE